MLLMMLRRTAFPRRLLPLSRGVFFNPQQNVTKLGKNTDILQHEIAYELKDHEAFNKFFDKNHARLTAKHYCAFLKKLHSECDKHYEGMVEKDKIKFKELFVKGVKNLQSQPGAMRNKDCVTTCLDAYSSLYIANEADSKEQLKELDPVVADIFDLLADEDLDKVLSAYDRTEFVPKKTLQTLAGKLHRLEVISPKFIFGIADGLLRFDFMEPKVMAAFISRLTVLSSKFGTMEYANTLDLLMAFKGHSERHKQDPETWKYYSLVRFFISGLYNSFSMKTAGLTEQDMVFLLNVLSELKMPVNNEVIRFPVEWLNTHPLGTLSQADCAKAFFALRTLGYYDCQQFSKNVWEKYKKNEFMFEELDVELQPLVVEALGCTDLDLAPLHVVVAKGAMKARYMPEGVCRMVYGFCRGGYINSKMPSILIALLMARTKSVLKEFDQMLTIHLAWSLCVAQSVDNPNPMAALAVAQIPRTKQFINLTFDDLVDMHQIIGYAKLLVGRKSWPSGILTDFTEIGLERSKQVYKQYDVCPEPEIRDDILCQLKKRGIEVKKDVWINDSWRVDIKEKNVGILITRRSQFNEKGQLRGREYMKQTGAEMSVKKLIKVDADKWNLLDKDGRTTEVEDIIKAIVQASIRK